MKKFLVLYLAPQDLMEKTANSSPEEMKDGMKPWLAWADKIGDGLVDMGSPTGTGVKMSKSGESDPASTVAGYGIIQAESLNEAKEMMVGHPHLEWDDRASIEVLEMMPLPS